MNIQKIITENKKIFSIISFSIFLFTSIIHLILTNMPGGFFHITKVFLMPTLALFFIITVNDLRKGMPILWAECGLWLGNICLIWGEESQILFVLGSAFTIIGFFGYIYILLRSQQSLSFWFIFLQMPIIGICVFFLLFMKNDLGTMLVPLALYLMLICIISLAALSQLLNNRKKIGAWLMFSGSLFYIAENGLYTASHYLPSLTIGENIVHPCFICAQAFFAVGYLLLERQK